MSGKGRGKTKKRDMIDAPLIRAAPGKVKSKGNIHKKAKINAEAKKAASKNTARSSSKKVAKKSAHQMSSSSSSEDEDEEVGGAGVQTSSDESQMSTVDEIPIPSDEEERRRQEEEADESEDEEDEDEFAWKWKLIEYVEQYPELYDKASARYKLRDVKEAAWDDIARAMQTDGNLIVFVFDIPFSIIYIVKWTRNILILFQLSLL